MMMMMMVVVVEVVVVVVVVVRARTDVSNQKVHTGLKHCESGRAMMPGGLTTCQEPRTPAAIPSVRRKPNALTSGPRCALSAPTG